jgi:hypothetical protein
MAGVFDVQGFWFLSNFNGQFGSSAAQAAMAETNANSIELAPHLFTQTKTSNDVFAYPAPPNLSACLKGAFG